MPRWWTLRTSDAESAPATANPNDADRFFEEDFWVDTGALYSIIPADRLEGIGIDPSLTREVILADGRRKRLRFGEARLTVEHLGETVTCPVLFGPPGSLHLLGATALENFGVDADPVAKRLKPVAAIIAEILASQVTAPGRLAVRRSRARPLAPRALSEACAVSERGPSGRRRI